MKNRIFNVLVVSFGVFLFGSVAAAKSDVYSYQACEQKLVSLLGTDTIAQIFKPQPCIPTKYVQPANNLCAGYTGTTDYSASDLKVTNANICKQTKNFKFTTDSFGSDNHFVTICTNTVITSFEYSVVACIYQKKNK